MQGFGVRRAMDTLKPHLDPRISFVCKR